MDRYQWYRNHENDDNWKARFLVRLPVDGSAAQHPSQPIPHPTMQRFIVKPEWMSPC